ncbi:MAG: 1-deoxy-D-xylulose-5-phosphate reductoisomerase [Kiritimatiellaeota bacterium]|nr:1-deoxy-D-xylulose-5-phosphate reductoisomerase [Kiritimatiellota bacterium]
MVKRVVILGSTGSIGENALKIVEALPGRFEVAGLVAHTNASRIVEQAVAHRVKDIALTDPEAAQEAARLAEGKGIAVHAGMDAVCGLAAMGGADLVVCAMVGMAALKPVLAAIGAGHDVALATKEVLVSAGELVMRERAARGVSMLPIDSEHSALFQCLQDARCLPWCVEKEDRHSCLSQGSRATGRNACPPIRRLILTASGGPFALRPEVDFAKVTVEDALAHPRWSMGRKVTVDSATMMNKGLEILEARWLFDVPVENIDVLLHPESVVHSLVEFQDATVMSQLGVPDMRLAIQYAMTWPGRVANATLPRLDLARLGGLTFREPDEGRFPCLRLVREAAAAGGTMPAVANAADEVAVEAFLAGRLPFTGIWRVIENVMAAHAVCGCADLGTVVEADAWARRAAREEIRL